MPQIERLMGYPGNILRSVVTVSREEYDAILASPPVAGPAYTVPQPGTMYRRAMFVPGGYLDAAGNIVDHGERSRFVPSRWAPAPDNAGPQRAKGLWGDDRVYCLPDPVAGPLHLTDDEVRLVTQPAPTGHVRLAWLALLGIVAGLLLALPGPATAGDSRPDAGAPDAGRPGALWPELPPKQQPQVPLPQGAVPPPPVWPGDEPSPSTGDRPG